jgi:magnesium-transporting ATPase (P-type)
MNATTREKNGPYSTGLGYLLLGFGLMWIFLAVVFVFMPSSLHSNDEYVSDHKTVYFLLAVFALLMAAVEVGSAVLIRWRPKRSPMPIQIPKVAFVSTLITAIFASLIACSEAFSGRSEGPNWAVLGCALVVFAASLSVMVLMILRRRFFQTPRPT